MPANLLCTAAEVLVATGHDPFARASLRRPLLRGWVIEGATAWLGVDNEERRCSLSALGEPVAVAALVEELLPELPPRQRVVLPRGTAALLPAWVGLGPVTADWDFRCLTQPPEPQEGEHRVVSDVDDEDVRRLLELASARASVRPGDAAVVGWWGVSDAAGPGLVACAADTSSATGVGNLSSLAVHPAERGRGLGKAVIAAVTRALLAGGCDVVTLRFDAANTAARALCDAVGFGNGHQFTSGPLVQRGRW